MPPFTFVALPDTQIYARFHPEHFEAQGRFLRELAARETVVLVLHEGDVTDDNSPEHWEVAARALDPIVGQVPLVFGLGNHDYAEGGTGADRTTRFHDYFPERLAPGQRLVAAYDEHRRDNVIYEVETPAGPWLAVGLEFAPRSAVVAWARETLLANPRPAVLVNHAYLYSDGTHYSASRSDQRWSPFDYGMASSDSIAAGDRLFRELVAPCRDLHLVVSGHVLNEGAALRSDPRPDGSVVHQMLANYQHRQDGGIGFLRLIRIDGTHVEVRTYSPVLDEYKTDPRNELRFELTL
ncbi:MAG: metallophosphoesterase [Myxococcota bacterium]